MPDLKNETLTKLLKELTKIDYVKPGEFPNIDLYMDQVTTFMNTHLSSSKLKADDKILTKTMINNYAKNNLLPPPEKKKYSKEHMIVLTFIYYFKNILSISEIQDMINPLTDRFFNPDDNPSHISMDDIYEEIFTSIKSQLSTINDDIMVKHNVEVNHFNNVKNKKDREFLQTFSLICMLSFDVFLKKQIIESLVESITPIQKDIPKKDSSKKEASKKETKAPAPDKKKKPND